VVAPGATQIAGTARSSTLLALAGDLGKTTNTEIALATLGFTSANNTSLGIRARRTTGGTSWQSTAIGLGVDVDNTVRAGACMWLHGNGNTGIGTDQPSAGLSVVAPGATEIAGTARSSTLLTSTGALGSAGGSEVALATLGFSSGNDSSLGIRARRTTTGAGWQSTAIGLGMDVDNTVRAGACMWLHGNGNTGIGTDQPGARLSVVAPGATEIAGTARSSTLLTSTGALGSAGGSEVALATLGFSSGNNSSLGIRARRTTTGASWQSTAIGLGMDVDNTVQAGASMWLHGNGNVGIGSTQPPNARLSVNSTAPSSPAMSVASSGNVSALFSESTGGGWGVGAEASGSNAAIAGRGKGNGPGVHGIAVNTSTTSIGVVGTVGSSLTPPAAQLTGGIGVVGLSPAGLGVGGVSLGQGPVGNGVEGQYDGSGLGAGVHAWASGPSSVALYAERLGGVAGQFMGNVTIQGTVTASVKPFKIDHPLDPANRYLSHVSVESPDLMTVYAGTVVTDANGESVIELPDYFEALNRDIKYQLTPIGELSQVTVAREVEGNRFTIRTERLHVKVSWQVTGVRRDRYAEAYPIPVDEAKPERERGRYLHPELYPPDAEARQPIGVLPGSFARPAPAGPSAELGFDPP
jgi:hypothetical protein